MPTQNYTVLAMLALLTLAAGCGSPSRVTAPSPQPVRSALAGDTPIPATPAAEEVAGLTRVTDPSSVCMVNNQYMHKMQIPIIVGGKTYFGCCEMCKARLARDASARMATDPVTGSSVDKATAVIARDAKDAVFYFENEATFRRYGGS